MREHSSAIRHIVAATDFSDMAQAAVARGFEVAQATGARFEVMHALGLDGLVSFRTWLGEGSQEMDRGMMDEALAQLDRSLEALEQRHGARADRVVSGGMPATAITEHLRTSQANLLVLGERGASLWQRALLGATSTRLLRSSPCPVLVVKRPEASAYRHVLLSVDFSPCSEQMLALTRQLAPDARLTVLHVFEVPFENKMHYAGVQSDVIQRYRQQAREVALLKLHQLLASAGLSPTSCQCVVLSGDPAQELVRYADTHQCDLVVMGKHGSHLTQDWLLGSVTTRALSELQQSDVLVVRDPREPDDIAA